jgi:hypothetical protein
MEACPATHTRARAYLTTIPRACGEREGPDVVAMIASRRIALRRSPVQLAYAHCTHQRLATRQNTELPVCSLQRFLLVLLRT